MVDGGGCGTLLHVQQVGAADLPLGKYCGQAPLSLTHVPPAAMFHADVLSWGEYGERHPICPHLRPTLVSFLHHPAHVPPACPTHVPPTAMFYAGAFYLGEYRGRHSWENFAASGSLAGLGVAAWMLHPLRARVAVFRCVALSCVCVAGWVDGWVGGC